MTFQPQQVILTYDLAEMDIAAICETIHQSYWGQKLTTDQIRNSFDASACAGLIYKNSQIGFARAISDRVTSAYIKDVFIAAPYQRLGFGRRIIEGLFAHPELDKVQSWYLGTKDAQSFYKSLGFKPAPNGIFMYLRK